MHNIDKNRLDLVKGILFYFILTHMNQNYRYHQTANNSQQNS